MHVEDYDDTNMTEEEKEIPAKMEDYEFPEPDVPEILQNLLIDKRTWSQIAASKKWSRGQLNHEYLKYVDRMVEGF
jgi:hypothetical protein